MKIELKITRDGTPLPRVGPSVCHGVTCFQNVGIYKESEYANAECIQNVVVSGESVVSHERIRNAVPCYVRNGEAALREGRTTKLDAVRWS